MLKDLVPNLMFLCVCVCLQEFKEWMATMVHCLDALAGKSSSATETVELQLAGCVLVTVLSRLGLLDSTKKSETLSVQILIELMNVLKLPVTDHPFIQEWCANFHGRITMNRYANFVDM